MSWNACDLSSRSALRSSSVCDPFSLSLSPSAVNTGGETEVESDQSVWRSLRPPAISLEQMSIITEILDKQMESLEWIERNAGVLVKSACKVAHGLLANSVSACKIAARSPAHRAQSTSSGGCRS